MNLGELLLTLQPLLEDPRANAARIGKLLVEHQSLAEYEVARFYASHAFAPMVGAMAKSVDPAERVEAARLASTVLGRVEAATLLRRMVKDPNSLVRGAARAGVRKLGLDDVALPDTRYEKPRRSHSSAIGGWNPTGWAFGLYRGDGSGGQLKKRGGAIERPVLPTLRTRAEVASFLGLASEAELRALSRAGDGKGAPYVSFEVPKASGGTRTISAPRASLKRVQRRILDAMLGLIPARDEAHGFVRKRSVVTNARPHVGSTVVVKLDLHDFFPTIHFRRVVGLFKHYGRYSQAVATTLAQLVTYRPRLPSGKMAWPGVLPQGAPTSPAIANAIARRLDARLSRLAAKAGATYTRYADDLTFSFKRAQGSMRLGRFFWWVDQICQAEGFVENAGKRRIMRRHNQQRVTGIVVNDKPTVPRARRRLFRAMLHRYRAQGFAAVVASNPSVRGELLGFAAYVAMVQPELGANLRAEVDAFLGGAQ